MTAEELLAQADALLLDFDGPICSVFAGIPAVSVADQLRAMLADEGHTDLPEAVAASGDPFDILRYTVDLGDDERRYIEAAFTAHEVEAVHTAVPTPGAHELMRAWRKSGRLLAVVSNNSVVAIEVYLDLYDLQGCADYVSARSSSQVTRLKPSPYLLVDAVERLGVQTADCVFIGDSGTDLQAASQIDMPFIGFVNKRGKGEMMRRLGGKVLTDSLVSLLR